MRAVRHRRLVEADHLEAAPNEAPVEPTSGSAYRGSRERLATLLPICCELYPLGHWRKLVEARVREIKAKNPSKRIEIDDENVAVFLDQMNKHGKPYRGMGIRPRDIESYAEGWQKIAAAVGGG